MKLVAYILFGVTGLAAGFAVLSAFAALFLIPIELADRIFSAMAMLAVSGFLGFIARSIYRNFIVQRDG